MFVSSFDIAEFIENIPFEEIVTVGVKILLILVFTVVALFMSKYFAKLLKKLIMNDKLIDNEETKSRAKTLAQVFQSFLKVIIYLVAVMMILKELNFDIAPLMATAGLGAVAIGFGAQSLIKDYFAGFFLLLEDQLRLGDVVNVCGIAGEVQKINLRTTILRDADGKQHIIPNGEIKIVTNYTKDFSKIRIDFGVAYKEKIDNVIKVLKKVMDGLEKDKEWKDKILETPTVQGVQELGDSAVLIRTSIKTQAGEQWGVGRELRRRVKNRFDEVGIEIPFPHQTIYFGDEIEKPMIASPTKKKK